MDAPCNIIRAVLQLLLVALLQDGSLGQAAEAWIKSREIPAAAEAPAWAKDLGEPRFTFAVIADIHWRPGGSFDVLDRACDFVNERKPAFLMVCGDNVSASRDTMKSAHEALKKRIDEKLKVPLKIVKGDNDARDYESVWGSSDYAFTYGGVRFIGFGQTHDFEGHGMGWYGNARWIAGDLWAHRKEPAILFTHVPPWPPMSVGSPVLAAGAAVAPNVAGTIAGHVHYDVESSFGGKPVVMAGALHFPAHAVKIAEVYEKRIVLKTYEWEDDRYAFADKWQTIEFPEGRTAEGKAEFSGEVAHAGGETKFLSPAIADAIRDGYWAIRGVRPAKLLYGALQFAKSLSSP